MKAKDQSIETLRGFAILLVVAGYIIKDDLAYAPHSLFLSSLRFVYYCLTPIRMPLFTVISSYLYAASPATRATFRKLVTGKMRRIMIPFAVVSAFQYAFFSVVPVKGPHPILEIYKVYLWPLDQFWFLYSIFWIFILVGAMDSFNLLDTPKKWLAWLLVSGASYVFFEPTHLFSIYGVNYLFSFFILGYGLRRFFKELFTRRLILFYFVVALAVYAFYIFFYIKNPSGGISDKLYKTIGLLISYSAVPLIFHYRKNIPFLAKIGYYAFGIHIFNKISAAIPNVLFRHFHIESSALIFFTFMTCAALFSIQLQRLLEKFAFTRQFVLGMKGASKGTGKHPGLSTLVTPEGPAPEMEIR